MKKFVLGTLLLALAPAFPLPTMAELNVGISISLPPPIHYARPPELVVLPETYVYVVPDAEVDIFFFNGWWWRPWDGRWYRSRHYESGWSHYRDVPSFYREIPPGWRNEYRERRWRGHRWEYRRIPHQQVQQHWNDWERDKYWERQHTWGVQGLQPRRRSPQPSQEMQQRQSQPQYKETRSQQQHKGISPMQHYEVKPQQKNIKIKPQQSQEQQEKHNQGKGNK